MFSSRIKFPLIFGTVAAVTLAAVVAVVGMSYRVHTGNFAVFSSMQALVIFQDARFLLESAEAGYRGYRVTGDPHYLADYEVAASAVSGKLKELRSSAPQGGVAADEAELLVRRLEAKLTALNRNIAGAADPDTASAPGGGELGQGGGGGRPCKRTNARWTNCASSSPRCGRRRRRNTSAGKTPAIAPRYSATPSPSPLV